MSDAKPPSHDIVRLLYLAPQTVQEQIGLDNANETAFIEYLDKCSDFEKTATISLALYYACRKITTLKDAAPLIPNLNVSVEILHNLIQISSSEEFTSTSTALGEIAKQARSKKGKTAVQARHSKPESKHNHIEAARLEIRKIWASGHYDTRERCAEEEARALGIPYSTARKALINQPDPVRQP